MADRFQDIPGYEMIGELGEGGMATVYLAIQHSLDRKVAIKVMRRELRVRNGPMPEFERRFLLEGRTMAKLPHRNIVAVYDIVSTEDVAYIAMEFLEGGTLSDRMQAGLSLAEAVSVFKLDGMQALPPVPVPAIRAPAEPAAAPRVTTKAAAAPARKADKVVAQAAVAETEWEEY